MLAVIYALFFVCSAVFAVAAIRQSLTDHQDRIAALFTEQRSQDQEDIITVTIAPAMVFIAAPAPDFASRNALTMTPRAYAFSRAGKLICASLPAPASSVGGFRLRGDDSAVAWSSQGSGGLPMARRSRPAAASLALPPGTRPWQRRLSVIVGAAHPLRADSTRLMLIAAR
ncbi:hypothetical protein [Blastomonas sp. SL216]|uniref:hypothetical protein n=1 Tax=Blastomonas sp. SL216 TaxID=2995169 RepID=UPI002376E17D|nr:hypothetical protein OU999_10455 [Blastomonas sp. SL216]